MPDKYFVFICLYAYQIIKFETEIDSDFRDELKSLILTSKHNLSDEFLSWKNILKYKLNVFNKHKAANLLSELFYIYDTFFDENKSIISNKKKTKISFGMRDFNSLFDHRFIINFWIKFINTPRENPTKDWKDENSSLKILDVFISLC